MKIRSLFTRKELYLFIVKASQAIYPTGGPREKQPERAGFTELTFSEGDFDYRDSWTGFYRSRGMELVRFKNTTVWASLYGGGMIKGKKKLANETFTLLKKAFLAKPKHTQSFRGPKRLKEDDWEYKYSQAGDIEEFSGYEEILHKGKVVFFHRIIGGIIKHKQSKT